MQPYLLIKKKRDGHPLTEREIHEFIRAYMGGVLRDYQMAAFLMAVYFRGMTDEETSHFTKAMLESGKALDLGHIHRPKVDKHSTGGVGDKISLLLAPLVASAGVVVPMMSGRGLGHTGGTLDKLESIPGMRTDLAPDDFLRILERYGMAFMGQTSDLVPADRELYALRDVTATVECVPLIASSIMSKKLAEGIDGLIIDVKVGSGAFMKDIPAAERLASLLAGIGAKMNKRVVACLTDMDQPLGRAVGNSLEVQEAVEGLSGRGPRDVMDLTLELGAWMLILGGISTDPEDGRDLLRHKIHDGSGLRRFQEIISAQGGDPRSIEQFSRLPRAKHRAELRSDRDGYVASIQTEDVGTAAVALGAGRRCKEDRIDPAVGFILEKKRGDKVAQGEALAQVHYNDEGRREDALRILSGAYRISDDPPAEVPLIHKIVQGEHP